MDSMSSHHPGAQEDLSGPLPFVEPDPDDTFCYVLNDEPTGSYREKHHTCPTNYAWIYTHDSSYNFYLKILSNMFCKCSLAFPLQTIGMMVGYRFTLYCYKWSNHIAAWKFYDFNVVISNIAMLGSSFGIPSMLKNCFTS